MLCSRSWVLWRNWKRKRNQSNLIRHHVCKPQFVITGQLTGFLFHRRFYYHRVIMLKYSKSCCTKKWQYYHCLCYIYSTNPVFIGVNYWLPHFMHSQLAGLQANGHKSCTLTHLTLEGIGVNWLVISKTILIQLHVSQVVHNRPQYWSMYSALSRGLQVHKDTSAWIWTDLDMRFDFLQADITGRHSR
jgi:hypothetical protein